jgi:cytochrome c-type biogenesis protein CcmF
MPYVAGTLLVLSFFLVVIVSVSNPFAASVRARRRPGLNPQLQNYWMTIHPPTLYLGLHGIHHPVRLRDRRAAQRQARHPRGSRRPRRWTLLSWFFLTNGIIFGMMWAYVELGWGGYWFWDPVENASLLPWLTATAFLHSVMIQEKRGMLKMWNMLLVLGTFLLCIFATFLTRSGLIESVHSFAQNLQIAYIFLGFMSVATLACAGLVWWRRDGLEPETQMESFLSREAAFRRQQPPLRRGDVRGDVGDDVPADLGGVPGAEDRGRAPLLQSGHDPIGLMLLALLGIGPIIAWRKASARNLQRNFTWPVAGLALVVAGLFWLSGVRHAQVLLTFALGAFTLTTVVVEFYKGARAGRDRGRGRGEGVPAPDAAEPPPVRRLRGARGAGGDLHGLRRRRVRRGAAGGASPGREHGDPVAVRAHLPADLPGHVVVRCHEHDQAGRLDGRGA